MRTISLSETRVFNPGSLVRGRVVQSGGESFFEYAGGRIALAKGGAMPSGWHTYKVEQGPGGTRLTQIPDVKDAPLSLPVEQPQNPLPQGMRGIERLLGFLYPERTLLPRISGHEGEKSLTETFLKTFFALEPSAIEKIFASFRDGIPGAQRHADGKNMAAENTPGGETGGNTPKKDPEPCLLRFDAPFLPEGGIPLFVVPQDGRNGAQKTIWVFSEIVLDGLGHTAFCLRYSESRISGEIYCQKGCKLNIEGCLPDSLASLRVYERNMDEVQGADALCAWALRRLMEACPGEYTAYA